MYEITVTWLVMLIGIYFVAGIVAAVPIVLFGIARMDPAARGSSRLFRLTILPGVIAFWPLLLRRWLTGQLEPPKENTPHKKLAR